MRGKITHEDLANPIRRGIVPVSKNWGVTPETTREAFIYYYRDVVCPAVGRDDGEGYKIKEVREEGENKVYVYCVLRPFKINGLWMFADVEFCNEKIAAVILKPSLLPLWESCKNGGNFLVNKYNEEALPIVEKWMKNNFGKPISRTDESIVYDYYHRGIDLRADTKKADEEIPVRITIKYIV